MNRRFLLGTTSVVAATAGLLWWQRNPITRAALSSETFDDVRLTESPDGVCALTPEQIEGPFFISAPERSDIREDRSGLPLELTLAVSRGADCQPVAGAIVEIWHCDAAGRYSGYDETLARRPFDTLRYLGGPEARKAPENGKTYLRGAQRTGDSGEVHFTTILPGWYEPRVTHIHVKVLVGNTEQLTTQLYFPTSLTAEVYAEHPSYAPYGASPYHHGNDAVLGNQPAAEGLLLNPTRLSTELSTRRGGGLRASGRMHII